jgi:hypothetical protein
MILQEKRCLKFSETQSQPFTLHLHRHRRLRVLDERAPMMPSPPVQPTRINGLSLRLLLSFPLHQHRLRQLPLDMGDATPPRLAGLHPPTTPGSILIGRAMVDPTAHRKSHLLNLRTILAPIGSFIDHRPNIIEYSHILKNLIITTAATNTSTQHTTINGIIPTAVLLICKVSTLTTDTTKTDGTSSSTSSTLTTNPITHLSILVSGTTPLPRQLVMLLLLPEMVTTMFLTHLFMLRQQRNIAKRSIVAESMPIPNLLNCTITQQLITPLAITGPLACGLRRPHLSPQDLPTKTTLIFSTVVY